MRDVEIKGGRGGIGKYFHASRGGGVSGQAHTTELSQYYNQLYMIPVAVHNHSLVVKGFYTQYCLKYLDV
jgi:hypothetical protein